MGCVLYGVYLLAVPHDGGYGSSADLGRGFASAKLQDATDLGMHSTFVERRGNRQVDIQLAVRSVLKAAPVYLPMLLHSFREIWTSGQNAARLPEDGRAQSV